MKFDVSIIIPVYNCERSIARCLDSIFNQKTSFSYEVITVTDQCADNTLSIIEDYVSKHQNFKNINVSVKSAGVSRNIGIKEANGEYLMFIDGDDYYKEDAIETLVKTIKESNADIVCSSYYYIRGKKIKKNIFAKNHTYDKKGMLKELMKDSYMHGFMWNKIYKSELLQGNLAKLPKENIIREDVLTNFQLFMNSNKLVMINTPLYYYDKTYESSTSAGDKTRIPWFITIFATERYLIEKHNPELLPIFRSLHSRRKLLIWGDELFLKKAYTKEELKELKKTNRKLLNIINKEGNLILENQPWESFIKENFHEE